MDTQDPMTGNPSAARPLVTVVAPTYNEERYIEQFAACMAAQDFPGRDFEVLIVDGGSGDRTREMVRAIVARDPRFRLVDNPGRFQPQARNVGVRNACGEYILMADVHAEYPPDYIRASVEAVKQTGAWLVGPILTTAPGAATRVARAIAIVQSHRFGVGNSEFRIGKEAREVDTVAFGCIRRATFEKVGLYHELLPRHEDNEMHGRLRRAGGKIMVTPAIRATYYARPTVRLLLAQAWASGFETAMAKVADPAGTSLRHWIPAAFVASLIVLGAAAPLAPYAGWLLALDAGMYLLALMAATLHVGLTRSGWMMPWVAPIFAAYHLTYGLGTLAGIFRLPGQYARLKAYRHPVLGEEKIP